MKINKKHLVMLNEIEEYVEVEDYTVDQLSIFIDEVYKDDLPSYNALAGYDRFYWEKLFLYGDNIVILKALYKVYSTYSGNLDVNSFLVKVFPSFNLLTLCKDFHIKRYLTEKLSLSNSSEYLIDKILNYPINSKDSKELAIYSPSVDILSNDEIYSTCHMLLRNEILSTKLFENTGVNHDQINPLIKSLIQDTPVGTVESIRHKLQILSCVECMENFLDKVGQLVFCKNCKDAEKLIDSVVENLNLLNSKSISRPDYMRLMDKLGHKIKKNNTNKILKPKALIKEINSYVEGQDKLVNTLSNMLYMYSEQMDKANAQGNNDKIKPYPMSLLIGGNTGTGKTYTADLIASKFNMPVINIDVTTLSSTGYVGNSIDDIVQEAAKELKNFYFNSSKFYHKFIIFFDEIDKILGGTKDEYDFKRSVQNAMLRLMEKGLYGTDQGLIRSKAPFIILAGSFMNPKKKNMLEKKNFGFNERVEENKELFLNEKNLIDFGIIPELVGRITAITETEDLTEKHYLNILLNKKETALDKILSLGKHVGFKLSKKEKEKLAKKIAKEVSKNKIGTRGLEVYLMKELLNYCIENG